MTNRLTLVPARSADRFGLAFWELTVDGRPLRELVEFTDPEDRRLDVAGLGPAGENVPVLVHNWPTAGVDGALELAGERVPQLTSGRVLLYVCPACGDVGCGAVSAVMDRSEQTVVWRDFGWDVGWEDGEDDIRFAGGPFVFDRGQYDAELRRFVDTYAAVRASVPALTPLVEAHPRGRRRWWRRSGPPAGE
ncbi:hypothetical protein [Cellulomonas sp.]|uniref:hypothetical protein n=1 Tax=Cellulomonas sp. TaxID=40001 RepID=UPI001B27142B|nr:hypothetical protein [Cellulomonas sp.]MBO9555978.1 hypothetical protein [Cellulomonas sp.]